MNSLRNKLIASVTMLAVAAIMLTSASFAWYTVSTKGEVEAVKVEMEAKNNLEIAQATDEGGKKPEEVKTGDSGDETTWGSKVTKWAPTEKVQLPATMSEFSGVKKLYTVNYDNAGRVQDVTNEASVSIAEYTTDMDTNKNGIGYAKANVNINGVNTDNTVAVVYGIWLRSNKTLTDVVGTIDTDNLPAGVAKDAVTAVFRAKEDGNWEYYESGNKFSLTADEPKFVEVVLFFDGDKVFAKDIDTNDLVADGIKVVFESASLNAPSTPTP